MGQDGKIYRLECMRDYTVAKTCMVKGVYGGGVPGPLGSTIPVFAPKNDLTLVSQRKYKCRE